MGYDVSRREVIQLADILSQWADELVRDIFIADGGVDDWDSMTEPEIRQIVYRELHNHLAELVVSSVISLQRTEGS